MQGQDYIFFLQAKDRSFWQIDTDGMVTKSNKAYPLVFSPDGWNDISIQNIRNKKYWGIDRSVSIPLSYVGDGATIIKSIMLKYGIEESVYLIIAKQELHYVPGVDYGYWYKQIYRGEVDLSTYSHAGAKVNCTTLEDGLAKYLKANEGTVYELPMNVPEAINVKMDGIKLLNKVDTFISNGFNQGNDPNFDIGNHTLETQIIQEDAPFVGGKKATKRVKYGGNNVELLASDEWLLDSTIDGVIDFSYKIDFTLYQIDTPNPAQFFRIVVASVPPNGFVTNRFIIFESRNEVGALNRSYLVEGTASINILKGEKLFLYGFSTIDGAGGARTLIVTYNSTSDNYFNYSYKYIHPTTFVKAFRPQYLFEKLINKVTEGAYTAAVSAYFNKYKQLVITCGNSLRGLPNTNMKISFNDFFQFWDSIDSVGLIDLINKIDFGEKKDLVDTVNYIDLSEPTNFRVNVAKDYLINEIEIGYPEISNEIGVLNGNEEFNCKFLFSVGTTKSPQKLDKISKIKASCYEIEKIRITTENKDSTDYKSDNTLFALHVSQFGSPTLDPTFGEIYELDRTLNTSVTGLVEYSTVFNIFLSPKRNLLRNGDYISSSMYLANTLVFDYKSSDKNNKMVANGVVEKDPISVAAIGTKFFLPILFDFDVPAPNNLIDLLNLNPLQVFRFHFDGNYYFGILQKVSIAPSSRKEQSYQLLSINQDLTKLIDYYG